ncbi:MAG: phosphoribosylamine--glycine ligase [Gammaproteobacteria bacterium]|nr:phosphoribosylamine--glycine ligase [Gammaproteobacteria bacterium]
MKVLIIGAGGREHALAWKAAQSNGVTQVLVAPGNAGTALEPGVRNVAVAADDLDGLLTLARDEDIALTIVGPEQPLVAGVVDRFEAAGLACFGPRQSAARLEGSKAFAKAFLARHAIPTAAFESFTDIDAARAYLRAAGAPIVVKADGLAAGKGVIVADSLAAAEAAVEDMLAGNAFGEAGHRVVIEEFLEGEEASFIAMVANGHILPLASSQDHKARDDGDVGPNTGGMGAYSPAPVLTSAIHERVMREVMQPTVAGLAAEGIDYTGFLYAGLMIDAQGTPRVLEFNCRFGDPETQPIMMRLRSDLVALCQAAVSGTLHECTVEWDARAALGVVLAAGGYPGGYASGQRIDGLEQAAAIADTKVFHAGTRLEGTEVVTAGGRVLCATGLGASVAAAAQRAYEAAACISWDGMFHRNDIGHRAIARERRGD